MTKTLTLAAIATAFSTAAFAMVPSNDNIKSDIMDLGFSASEVAQIPVDQLQFLGWSLTNGEGNEARNAVRAQVAGFIYDGGVSAEEFAAWDAHNGDGSDRGLVAGVDFVTNGGDAAAVEALILNSGSDADQIRYANRPK